MKRTTLFVLFTAALAVVFSAAHAWATPLIQETFTYADGNLVGKDPPVGGAWASHSGAGTGPVQVTGGQAQVLQATGKSEDVNSTYEGGYVLGAGGVLYSGFDLNVTNQGTTFTATYFAMFLTGTSNFDARLWVTTPTSSGYRLALSNDNSISNANGEVFSTDLAFGTTYRIVTKYDYDAKAGTLWINPVTEGSASLAATDPGFSDASIAYAFRQASPGGSITESIDNLAVGTTFADAVAVPEPCTLALSALGLVGLVGVARRRKVA
jgi:hypothetical protein